MPNWYQDCGFILHYDHPFTSSEEPPAISGLDPEQVRRLLREVQPDAVHYHVKGSAGYVPYPTRLGNELHTSSGTPETDLLGVYRGLTHELGIHLILGYSGLIDYRAASWRPDWQRVASNYAPYPN